MGNSDGHAHFCFPFEIQLAYTASEKELFAKFPTLYFKVSSVDSWQRFRCEGYGYTQLPDVPGSHMLEIDTWRPKGSTRESQLNRFFIGATPELDDWTYLKQDRSSDEPIVSRFHFKTETAGTLCVRLNCAFHERVQSEDKELQAARAVKKSRWKAAGRKAGGPALAVDGLTEVLDAFHLAR